MRSAYQRFNDQDFEGVLELLDADVEWPDSLNDSVLYGRNAVRAYWERHFEVALPTEILGEVVEIGDAVVAVSYRQVYEREGGPFGPPAVVVHRFTFRGDRVARMEVTPLDETPDYVRERFRKNASRINGGAEPEAGFDRPAG